MMTALIAIALLAQASSARDQNWTGCRGTDADARITGCSALILAGGETPADLAEAYHNRGSANRAKRLFDLAIQDYNEAIRLKPSYIDGLTDRAITLILMGRFADALPDLTKVIELDPKSGDAMSIRGVAYEGMGLVDLALEDLSAAIAQDPRDAARVVQRGSTYFRRRDYDKALADYEQALSIDPRNGAAFYGRGIVKRLEGDAAAADADAASAKRLQPDIEQEMTRAGIKAP